MDSIITHCLSILSNKLPSRTPSVKNSTTRGMSVYREQAGGWGVCVRDVWRGEGGGVGGSTEMVKFIPSNSMPDLSADSDASSIAIREFKEH